MAQAKIATPFTIADAGTTSNVLNLFRTCSDAFLLGLMRESTDADAVRTYTIEVTNEADPTAATEWATLTNVAGTSIVPPAAGKALAMQSVLAYTGVRIKASGAVTNAQIWYISKHVR